MEKTIFVGNNLTTRQKQLFEIRNMLSRRILRIKAFKTLYAYAEDASLVEKDAEKFLLESLEATRDMYLFLIALAPELVAAALRRIEARRAKFNPTEEDLNPNTKFIDNQFTRILASDPDLSKMLSRKKLSWQQYDVFIGEILDNLSSRDYFKEYMSSPASSLQQDAALFKRIYTEEFEDNESLAKILEDLSILWNDDLGYVLSFIVKDIDKIARKRRWECPPLYNSDIFAAGGRKVDSDSEFLMKLFRTSFGAYKENFERIASGAEGWESDRLFSTDTVLIDMGLSEARVFPEIPVRVTINEYVEIAKFYGAPKSRVFVNGLLDRLIKQDIEAGIINKNI